MQRLPITKEQITNAIEQTKTMAAASRIVNISFSSFKRYAEKFGVYKPNPGGKGTHYNIGRECYWKFLLKDILNGKYPNYHSDELRIRLFKEGLKPRACEKCKLTEWLGTPISLELHHKDGIKTNHKWKNLEILCPNCQAQTETYRGKNIKVLNNRLQ